MKSSGFDLITAEVARWFSKRAIVLLTYIYNAIIRLSYFSLSWKFSQIVMFAKPEKPPDNATSYRPISLLPYLSKIYERLILKRLSPRILANNILPASQFGCRAKYNTIHQDTQIIWCYKHISQKKMLLHSCLFRHIPGLRPSLAWRPIFQT